MKKITLTLSLIVVLFTLFSCDKNKATSADIVIMTPNESQIFHYGDSVHIEGTIVGDGELHGYSLVYSNQETGDVLYNVSTENHAKSYVFHEHWFNNVTDTTLVKIKVEVTIDHDGSKTFKERTVTCLPN